MVAMSGAIMPQPLAMPPSVKVEPRITTCLGLWSVVRMPRAASSARSTESFFASFGMAARIGSIGNGVPMIPVEQTMTSLRRPERRRGRGHHFRVLVARPSRSRHWRCPS